MVFVDESVRLIVSAKTSANNPPVCSAPANGTAANGADPNILAYGERSGGEVRVEVGGVTGVFGYAKIAYVAIPITASR